MATVVFADLVGSTGIFERLGDETAGRFVTQLTTALSKTFEQHSGRVVKLLGDGVMLRYPSASDAVRSVQGLMAEILRAGLPPAHAGITAGPLVIRDGDVYGHTVNLAARIAGHAGAGELLVAGAVMERLDPAHLGWVDLGDQDLKGLAEPVRLARITPDQM